jgi:hypothetical protein
VIEMDERSVPRIDLSNVSNGSRSHSWNSAACSHDIGFIGAQFTRSIVSTVFVLGTDYSTAFWVQTSRVYQTGRAHATSMSRKLSPQGWVVTPAFTKLILYQFAHSQSSSCVCKNVNRDGCNVSVAALLVQAPQSKY